MKGLLNAIKWEVRLDVKEYTQYRVGLFMDLTVVLFFRLLTSISIHLVTYVGIIGFTVFTTNLDMRDVVILVLTVLISLPSLLGMYGMGLIFAGISICQKNTGSLILIIQTVLLILTNALAPSRSGIVAIVPFSVGVDIARNVYMGETVQIIMVLLYFLINIVWLGFGLLCFRKALRYEKRYGTFDNY